MKRPDRVEDYLAHILEAIARATSYISDSRDIQAFERNVRDQDAISRNIEIIGEAATALRRIAPDLLAAYPEIPWAEMQAMRNFVIHAYFSVNPRIVWNTVRNDLPLLERQINDVLTALRSELGSGKG